MRDEIKVPTMKVTPLKKICMTIGELPTSYLETMTYYEMLVWFTNFLRDNIIPTVNNNAEAVHELQILFVKLQDYVNNYFDNLDVQEEINNKLDNMLESGQLEQIIEQFIQSTAMWCFDTVEDMKEATNLIDGSYAKTLGYYSVNDGGGATYKITDTASLTEYQEELDSGLYATLIINKATINMKQVGCKSDDNTFDSIDIIQSIIDLYGRGYTFYFPYGEYFISKPIVISNNYITLAGENERTYITKTSNTGVDITIVTSDDITYNLNNYDMNLYIGKESSADETISKVSVKNIRFVCFDPTDTSYAILAIGTGYLSVDTVQLADYNRGIYIEDSFATNLNKITALTFGGNRSAIEIHHSTAVYITNSYLNARYYSINSNDSRIYVDNVACDGHGIVWNFHDNTYASIVNSRTETYGSILSVSTNSQCNISNCDMEFHKPSGSENAYGIRAAGNSNIVIENSLIRYNNYTVDQDPASLILFNNANSLIDCHAYLNLLSIPMNNTITGTGSNYIVDLNTDGRKGNLTPETGVTITTHRIFEKDGYVRVFVEGHFSTAITASTNTSIGTISGITLPPTTARCLVGTGINNLYTDYSAAYVGINSSGVMSIYTPNENQQYFVINLQYKI